MAPVLSIAQQAVRPTALSKMRDACIATKVRKAAEHRMGKDQALIEIHSCELRQRRADEDLFQEFQFCRDEESLAELARRWHAPAYRVARSVCLNNALAEEAVQDAFVELLARRSGFGDRGPGSFRAWFLTLVANRARMARRRERRSERKRKVDSRSFFLRKGLEARACTPHEDPRDLQAALAQIEERYRTPILLYFMEGLQQQEVASRLHVSQQAISRRIEQGLRRLRKCALPASG